MTRAKTGSVLSQRCEEAIEGSARSPRRSIRGPELGLGAAIRVRRAGALLRLKRDCRGLGKRNRGGMLCGCVGGWW